MPGPRKWTSWCTATCPAPPSATGSASPTSSTRTSMSTPRTTSPSSGQTSGKNNNEKYCEEKYTFDLRPGFPVSNNSRNCLLYSCDRSYPFKVRQTGPGSRDPADYCGFFMNFMINRDFVDAGPPRDSWLSRANHPAVRLIFWVAVVKIEVVGREKYQIVMFPKIGHLNTQR